MLLILQVLKGNDLHCEQLQEVTQSADLSSLPDNAVILKQQLVQPQLSKHYTVSVFPNVAQHLAVGATFGQSLPDTATCDQGTACHLAGTLLLLITAWCCVAQTLRIEWLHLWRALDTVCCCACTS